MPAIQGRQSNAHDMLSGIVVADGCVSHPHVSYLLAPRSSVRDLADAVHALCAVHGRHPGMIDDALGHCAQPEACDWMTLAARGFADERAALVQLAADVGPLPSTPGQAESEAALAGVRHAVAMLARSDRGGCATGAAAALVIDWSAVRGIMARAAAACGVELAPSALPKPGITAAAVAMLGAGPAIERAMSFGARQILAQHRGLWDLLAARAAARERS